MPAPALPNLLLVEGTSDQLFFRALCKTLGLDTRTTVKVAPPRELQASAFNTKQGVLNHLPVLLRQLDDGQLRHLGVVIDADSPPDGGFPATRDRITRDLAGFGYSLKPEHPHSAGLLFAHDDGLPDIGVWVMPDNSGDGTLENWVRRSLHEGEQPLFDHACAVVNALPQPHRFRPTQRAKAEMATWLAWQSRPGFGIDQVITSGLLDPDGPDGRPLRDWLLAVFPASHQPAPRP